MEVCSKLPRPSRRQFEEQFSKIESERTVQMMEAELTYHRKMSMAFESTLLAEQETLSKIEKRQQRRNQMQSKLRETFEHSRGDDFE